MWIELKRTNDNKLYINLDHVKYVIPLDDGTCKITFIDNETMQFSELYKDVKSRIDNVRNFVTGH